jgi:tellurite resistance protein TerC
MFESTYTELWVVFAVVLAVVLSLDLLVLNRKAHRISLRSAAIWSLVWISLALLYNLGIYFMLSSDKALEFLTGYLVEESLSVDNLFIFLVIFRYFQVAPEYQHRVLFWGVIGAMIFRLIMILIGTALVSRFHWVLYIFGGLLVVTAVKLAMSKGEGAQPERNLAFRVARRLMSLAPGSHGERFWVKINGRWMGTTLLLVLVTVELSDVLFALDSIPAIFGITQDAFIIFTSNIFAIMGLRTFFFLLSGIMDRFYYLNKGLSLVLGFIGIKMLIGKWLELSIGLSLGVVAGILALSVLLSLWRSRRLRKQARTES